MFDTDVPNGDIAGHHPRSSRIVDFAKTTGQVALFDTVINEPEYDYLVDLQAENLRSFFRIFNDISFDAGAREAGVAITVYYVLDRTVTSVQAAKDIRRLAGRATFVTVVNEAVGNVLVLPQAASIHAEINPDRTITLPRLSIEALNLTDQPEFTFSGFIASNGMNVPLELRVELFGFLEAIYNQKKVGEEGGEVIL